MPGGTTNWHWRGLKMNYRWSIVKCFKRNLQLVGGNVEICLGQKSVVQHAIYTPRRCFLDDRAEAILLMDARNAFNSLNSDMALKHIKKLCPSIYTTVRSSYKTPSDLFIDKRVIKSHEETRQGDPIAMEMYGLDTLPLIDMLRD